MASKTKPNGYWTLERCQEEARRYSTRKSWAKGSPSSYDAAGRKGWRELCCTHMKVVRQKWSKERCLEIARRFQTIKDWMSSNKNSYHAAHKNGWLQDCTEHMDRLVEHGRWTKDACLADAKKYKTRGEWAKAEGFGYNAATQNGWLDECCQHMIVVGDHKHRCVYRIFAMKEIYIGITHDFETRMQQHRDKGKQVKRLIKKHGPETLTFEKITDYIPAVDAQRMEAELVQQYSESGWTVLNIAKAGALGGGTRRWTRKRLLEDAAKFETRSQWQKESAGAYAMARRMGIFDECCSHMPEPKEWSVEDCIADAKNYNKRGLWLKNSPGAYSASKRLGIFDQCCEHMDKVVRYSDKELLQDAQNFETRMAWKSDNPKYYDAALSRGLLPECTAHMKVLRKQWSEQDCIDDAAKYESKSEWQEKSNSAYGAARRLGIFDKCTKHMPKRRGARKPDRS